MQLQFGYDAITAYGTLAAVVVALLLPPARKPVAILQSAGPACRICQLSSVSTRVKNPAHHDNRRILPSESNQRRLQHRARRRRPRLCPSGFRWVGASGFRSFHVALGGDTRWRRRAKHRESPPAAIRVLGCPERGVQPRTPLGRRWSIQPIGQGSNTTWNTLDVPNCGTDDSRFCHSRERERHRTGAEVAKTPCWLFSLRASGPAASNDQQVRHGAVPMGIDAARSQDTAGSVICRPARCSDRRRSLGCQLGCQSGRNAACESQECEILLGKMEPAIGLEPMTC